jgi:N-acyl-D-amino-acid deacylase
MLAARAAGSSASVRFLLEQGAAADPTNKYGATSLMAAVASEDERSVRLLLDRGAYVNAQPNPGREGFAEGGGRTALQWAAYRGHERLVKLLLARGADVNQFTLLGTPLSQAAWGGHVAVARILLAAGARVDQRDMVANFTPLHWAASAEHSSPDLVNLLLAKGADVNAEGGQPVDGFLGVSRTPLMLARQRGETAIVQALLKAGARGADTSSSTRPGPPPLRQVVEFADPDSITAAIQFALLPLQKTADDSYAAFRRHATRQDCISCHQQELPLAAFERVNARYLAMNRGGAQRQLQYLVREMGLSRHFDSKPTFHPEPATGHGYALFAMRMAGQPPSAETDTLVHYLATIQSPDGRWRLNLPRPPMQSGDITSTALALHGIRSYAPPGRGLEIAERVDRARAWLKKAEPELNEERAYQLLGLWWTGERPSSLKGRAADLIREQRPDGGWAQLATLPSDAYATGLSLFALLESSAVPATSAAVQNGLRFLLRTQLADGTWHVRRRAFPFQPPMDSGFPHGADGWISSTATSWAVLAMATALDPRQVPSLQPVIHVSAPDATSSQLSDSTAHAASAAPAAPVQPSVDFAHTIQPLLERSCLSCHSGERAKGGFVLATRAALLKGGNRGEPPIVPGRPEASLLLRLLQDQVPDLEMPPLGKREKFPALTKDEIATVNRWIAEGANWPSAVTLHAPQK